MAILIREVDGVDFQDLTIDIVRGSTFETKLFQYADTDDSGSDEPGDLTDYEFAIQVRTDPRSTTSLITITNEYFFLGQSDDAIQYDIDEGNAPGTTKDEVYVSTPAELLQVRPGNWYWDLKVTDPNDIVSFPIGGRFNITQNVTRVGE